MSNTTIVRQEFSQTAVWGSALGPGVACLGQAVSGECIDAPDVILAGAMYRTEPFDDGSPLIQVSPALPHIYLRGAE